MGAGKIEKAKRFLLEVRTELEKVSWTSRKALMSSTILVLFILLLIAIFSGVVDRLFELAIVRGRYSIFEVFRRISHG